MRTGRGLRSEEGSWRREEGVRSREDCGGSAVGRSKEGGRSERGGVERTTGKRWRIEGAGSGEQSIYSR